MSEPFTPNAQYQYQGQQPYYHLTPSSNNPDFQNNQPYMTPPNQAGQNYIGTPQVNNPQNYVINSNSPYNNLEFNNGEITNKRFYSQIFICAFLYMISSVDLILNFNSILKYIHLLNLLIIIVEFLILILAIIMTINTCKRNTSRNIVNGIISLLITIIYGVYIILCFMNKYTNSNIPGILFLIFFIFLTTFNFKPKCCNICE